MSRDLETIANGHRFRRSPANGSMPGLPGCWSQDQDEQEALSNIQDAIREYLAVASDLMKDADIREVEVTPGSPMRSFENSYARLG